MPKNSSLLGTLTHFLNQSPYTSLELTFAHHTVCHHQNGQFLNRLHKQQSRLLIHKLPNIALAQMVVVDNLLFNFSFSFHRPTNQEQYRGTMLQLPRPLDQGHMEITGTQLVLSFRIDAPDPALSVNITQTYFGSFSLEKFYVPQPVLGEL
ncbi:hypothetical protein [Flagellimonas nanhaiensis]|uniref:Uncharacterized protein n=1 Tax=Flagellimonas nanhaiensis TaxID=2292706 RepID=A0A371JPG4_9FLAO|nr:hypothetical protein [Allomuricauda nanhaiensis]RDY59397.1 hypothetical protein DX873_08400 [Allomuricauda nanhaiensis]